MIVNGVQEGVGAVTTAPDVTLVVVPRERFQMTRRSLESIYATTTFPFALVYVDGGSSAPTRRYLEGQARARGFRLVRTDRYLAPNQARNLGISEAATRYIVFVDNDVLVTSGWLEALVRCAEETGAWVVGPLYCQGELECGEVHMTGGHAHIFDEAGSAGFGKTTGSGAGRCARSGHYCGVSPAR